jgi:signal transduction histidine kinase
VRRNPSLRTTSARLSIVYAGLLMLSFALVGALTWVVSRSAAEAELRDRITLEIQALQTEAQVEGVDAVIEAIAARTEQPGSLEYAFTDATGRLLGGDATLATAGSGWGHLHVPDDDAHSGGHEELLVMTQTLDNGMHLAVGADLSQTERLRNRILGALFGIGAMTALLVLIVGWLATRATLGRMRGFNAALARVETGDLTARVPVRSVRAPDDIDLLATGINTMLSRIAQLVSSVRRVSTEIAHDLRTPLSHLQQKLERARTTSDDGERGAELDSAQEKVSEILRTFDAMLRLAEIESGTARSRFTMVDLPALIERVADAYRPDFETSGRVLKIDRVDQVRVWGDADLLTQALSNLIENALRHTRVGATVTIEALADSARRSLTVRDDGPGVAADDRARIVAPFVRLDAARAAGGAGLGLSIVAAVAALHDASLQLRDAHPGLEATIEFPRRQ